MTAKREKTILAVGIAVFVVASFVVAVFKYQRLGYNGFDLAIYNQTFWNTIHGRLFADSMNPPSYLGDHAEWLIAALAPLYALVPHPLTLVFLKIVALGLSAIIVWKISVVIFAGSKNERRWPILFAVLWLINPFVWNQALFEFHLLSFSIPAILGAAYFYIVKKYPSFIASIVILLLVREDMALVVMGFVALALYDRFREHRNALRWALVPAVLAVIVFLIDQRVITHFNPDGAYKYLVYYQWLGNTPGEIIKGIFFHPLAVLGHILKPNNLEVALALILPFFFLPLAGGRYLFIMLFIGVEYLLTASGATGTILKTQYDAPLLPVLMLGAVYGCQRAMEGKIKWLRPVPLPILPLALAIAGVFCWFTLGPGIGIAAAFRPIDARTRALRAAVALIPKKATAISSIDTQTSLSSRQYVWPINYVWLGKKQFGVSAYTLPSLPDYIVLDQNDFLYFQATFPGIDWTAPLVSGGGGRMRQLIAAGNYGTIFSDNGVALLKRGAGGGVPFVLAGTDQAIEKTANIDFGPIKYLGRSEADGKIQLFFSAEKKISTDPVIELNGIVMPLGNGIYPASDWKDGETVTISAPDPGGKLTLGVEGITGGLELRGDGSLFLKIDKPIPLGAPAVIRP